jgi:hypothetical protein
VISLEGDESDLDDTDVNDILKVRGPLHVQTTKSTRLRSPTYLLPLLQECNQGSPHEFSSFINSFPFDPIVQSYESELAAYSKAEFRKVGEASYSEVFGIGSVVLKIVPLRDEYRNENRRVHDVESPPTSDARDVLQEIAITRSMGELCEGNRYQAFPDLHRERQVSLPCSYRYGTSTTYVNGIGKHQTR